MLNTQENDGMTPSQKWKIYPEYILYAGVAMSFILGAIFFLFNDYLMYHSDFDLLLQAPLIFVPIFAIVYLVMFLYEHRKDFAFMWAIIPWFIGLCLIFISSYHYRSATLLSAQSTPTIILLLGISLLLMVPWISLKADKKIRVIGLVLSLEPFVAFYLYFNLVTYPFSGNSFTMGITNFTLWGSLYVLSAIVSLILAVLAWHVRKGTNKKHSSKHESPLLAPEP